MTLSSCIPMHEADSRDAHSFDNAAPRSRGQTSYDSIFLRTTRYAAARLPEQTRAKTEQLCKGSHGATEGPIDITKESRVFGSVHCALCTVRKPLSFCRRPDAAAMTVASPDLGGSLFWDGHFGVLGEVACRSAAPCSSPELPDASTSPRNLTYYLYVLVLT
jgi:hypothetical protein